MFPSCNCYQAPPELTPAVVVLLWISDTAVFLHRLVVAPTNLLTHSLRLTNSWCYWSQNPKKVIKSLFPFCFFSYRLLLACFASVLICLFSSNLALAGYNNYQIKYRKTYIIAIVFQIGVIAYYNADTFLVNGVQGPRRGRRSFPEISIYY